MRHLIAIVLTMCCFCTLWAQEFRCTVQVNNQKLLSTTQPYPSDGDKKIFETMKQAIEDFVNGRQWTPLRFEQHERIDLTVMLVLTSRTSATDFGGQLQLQMRRPVYNSTYTTGMFNYLEGGMFNFSFNESQPLEFDPGNYYGLLSSTLAYYCYLMLGIWMDSFSPDGGEPFFALAQQVQQTAQGSSAPGFGPSDGGKSRYWFIENHTNSAYSSLHAAYYNYHRLGLDMMTRDQERARKAIIASLTNLQEANRRRSNLLSVNQFIDTKIEELRSIFTPAPEPERQQVYDLVKEISPLNAIKIKEFNSKP